MILRLRRFNALIVRPRHVLLWRIAAQWRKSRKPGGRGGNALAVECAYCDRTLEGFSRSPEHVIPRSTGGHGLVIAVHRWCNRTANAEIDIHLPRCGLVRQARAFIGVVDPRTGKPYEERLLGTVRVMTEVEGGSAFDVFDPSDVSRAFEHGTPFGGEGARLQIALRGPGEIRVRPLSNPVVLADGCETRFVDEGGHEIDRAQTVLAIVECSRQCTHDDKLWARFAAKVGLGLLAVLESTDAALDDGLLSESA